jgi:hypothetical protein
MPKPTEPENLTETPKPALQKTPEESWPEFDELTPVDTQIVCPKDDNLIVLNTQIVAESPIQHESLILDESTDFLRQESIGFTEPLADVNFDEIPSIIERKPAIKYKSPEKPKSESPR